MRPQEMGQREASGRRQREVHPQQLHGGSELGAAAEAVQKAPCPPLAAMSTLCQCHESRNKSPGTLYPVRLNVVFTAKP